MKACSETVMLSMRLTCWLGGIGCYGETTLDYFRID